MKEYINRNIEKHIKEISDIFPVIMITGARQVGKSTLLNYIVPKQKKNVNFVTLDNLDLRALAKEDPELFLETYPTPLVIDEFQYAPELLSYIKLKVDKYRLNEFNSNKNSNGNYYLTSSQSFISMKNISESLAGRVGIIELLGLSTREIFDEESKPFIPDIEKLKKSKESKKLNIIELYERIYKGSYPEIYKNKIENVENFYESYIQTYIEKDIRKALNIKDELKFKKFMNSLAARTGQELNLSDIANDAEISVPTANDWLSILVNSGIIFLLEPYSNNLLKRIVKRPKIYFLDTGLACYLTKYPNAQILESSAYSGHIFETYVISEIIKSFINNGMNPKRYLYYYRDSNKNEIDLLIEYENKLYPVEIKKNKKPDKDSIKNFKVLDNLHKNIGNGIVLCNTNTIFPINKTNFAVPITYI